jgi:outer membrane protein TolC
MTVSTLQRVPRQLAAALGAGILLLAGACATDQRADVERYRAVSDPATAPDVSNPQAAVSLVEAMRRTAALNEQLAARGEAYIRALAERQRAAAALLPTVDLFSDVALRENTGSASIVQSALGVGGQYRLLTGLTDLRNADAAGIDAESRRWLILDLRESLLLQTAAAYYESLRAERLVEVLRSSVAAQTARLSDARARNEVGFARPLDVAQNEAQVSRTRTLLITATRQAAEARAAVSLLTNTDLRTVMLSDGFELWRETRDLEQLVDLAGRNRQDIAAARLDAEAARTRVDAELGRYAPTVTINLDYFLLRGPDDSAASIASLIALRLPLFSAGQIEADVRAAWSVFRQRVLDYRLRVREARRDVEITLLQVRSSADRAAELRTQVRAAHDALELATAAYQAGLGTNLELVTAQDQLLAAELDAASEEFTSKAAALALRRACGLLSAELIGSAMPLVPPEVIAEPDSPLLDRARPQADPGTLPHNPG